MTIKCMSDDGFKNLNLILIRTTACQLQLSLYLVAYRNDDHRVFFEMSYLRFYGNRLVH